MNQTNPRSAFEKIKEIIADAETDADKFFSKGNHTAGKRLRMKMLQIDKLSFDLRKTISAIKNSEKK